MNQGRNLKYGNRKRRVIPGLPSPELIKEWEKLPKTEKEKYAHFGDFVTRRGQLPPK